MEIDAMTAGALDVAVLVGSLRRQSWSRKLALALRATAPASLALEVVEIGAMSLYNFDDEPDPPQPWIAFRNRIRTADALLFVTPEYNRSIPSVLKNAIDVGSRPKGSSAFDGKPAAIVGVSPGAMGAFGAVNHLRQCLPCLNVATMPAPEAYIGGIDRIFGDDGAITVESTRTFLDVFMRTFADWIDKVAPVRRTNA
jgi:chromate reductase